MRASWLRTLFTASFLTLAGTFAGGAALAAPGFWSSNGPWGGVVNDFDVDPVTPTTLYATTRAGLFKSVDGGTSWSRMDASIPGGVYSALGLLLDRDQPLSVYLFDNSGRLQRSVDGAQNWEATGYTLPAGALPTGWDDQPGSTGTFFVTLSEFPTASGTMLLKTSDGGDTFTTPAAGLPSARNFVAVAVDPSNGLRVLAGREEYAMGTTGVPAEPSIYLSVDGGANWTGVLSIGTDDVTRADAITFGAGTTVYAHLAGQIYRSDDDGATWNGAGFEFAQHLQAHPSAANTVYLGSSEGLFKSTDSGATFAPVTGGLTANPTYLHSATFAPIGVDVFRIVPEPGFPAPGTGLWLATAGSGLFKSIDGGTNFSGAGINEGLGGVNIRALLVHPNPSTRPSVGSPGSRLYAGFGDTFVSSPASYVSTNTGATWNVSNNQLRASQLRALIVDPTTAGVTAPQVATSVLFAAGRASFLPGYRNGGLYRSTNGGTTWASFDGNLPTRTIGGFPTADIGTVRHIVLDPRSCTLPPTGTCSSGPLKRLYATGNGFGTSTFVGGISTRTFTHRIVRTDNADTATPNWIDVSTTLPGNQTISDCNQPQCTLTQNSVTPLTLLISPTDSNVLYVGTFVGRPPAGAPDVQSGVFGSTDGGATWIQVSNGLPRYAGYTNTVYDVLAMAMHPTDGNTLWATVIDFGTPGSASIYKTTDGGATWTESASGISSRTDIRALLVDPGDPNTLYASGAGNEANPGSVYKSEDGGATWRSISIGLPRDAALSLALDPFVPTVLHAGTTSGAWSIEQVPDDDGDGAPDATENNAPNGGDGNFDGVPDASSKDVGSVVVDLRPGPRRPGEPLGIGGFFTSDIISGTPTTAGGCTQAVDVQAQLAARHGRDYVDGVRFYSYPRDLVRFEILDCAQAIVDITFHGADFAAQFGWTFRYYGPQTPGALETFGFYDFSSRATRVAPNKWRLALDANQFGSYRPVGNAILFEGGPACYDDRTFQSGFENGTGFTPPACN